MKTICTSSFFFILVTIFSSCNKERDKTHFYGSFKICDNLTIEIYTIKGDGAYGGDVMSHYMTDSINFRKFIGIFDSAEEGFVYDCKNDSILVKKYSTRGASKNLLNKNFISIEELRRERKFE